MLGQRAMARLPGRGNDTEKDVTTLSDSQRLATLLTQKGRGSLLRGWFRELDLSGDLSVSFHDFCLACGRLDFKGDVYAVLGTDSDVEALDLSELSPEANNLIEKFRDWAEEAFGTFLDTWNAFAQLETVDGHLTPALFASACRTLHCKATSDEVTDMFHALDVEFAGYVSQANFAYLEKDKALRDQAHRQEKKRQKEKHRKMMAYVYFEDLKRDVQPTHRRAARPWLAQNFDSLPALVNQRNLKWKHVSYERSLEARIIFIRHLRATFGNEVRAWRRCLDPECHFAIDMKAIRRYCRKSDLKLDTAALWRSLDKDFDGFFRLEELSVRAADVLASFQHWARRVFGSCEAIWDCREMENARARQLRNSPFGSEKKLLIKTFKQFLKACDSPLLEEASLLLSSLDLQGCGFIECSDLDWLDKWRPPEFLHVEPDPEAWEQLKEMMLHKYTHPLKAWRHLLDADSSNNVSWVEFKEACHHLRFKGNIGGAWRVLNENLSGSISMKEYDAESAHILQSFKDWADVSFGSVTKAFKAVDEQSVGYVTFPELRRACQKLKSSIDVRLLFDCIDIDHQTHGGKRCLGLKDVEFLDDWEGDRHPEEVMEDHVVNQALAKKPAPAVSSCSSLPSLSPSSRLLEPISSRSMCLRSDATGDTRTSAMSQKEQLHRTYHCVAQVQGSLSRGGYSSLPAPMEHRTLLQARHLQPGMQKIKPGMRKARSLPWLSTWLEKSEEMDAIRAVMDAPSS